MIEPDARTRHLLLRLFETAVESAHPRHCLAPHLPEPPAGRLILLAAGKAGASMAAVAAAHYRRLGQHDIAGLAVCRHGYGEPVDGIEVVEAGHPVPDAAGVAATERVLDLARGAGADDLVLVLLSGGGSANWIAPAPGLPLSAKQALTKALLRSGADIGEINTVRKHLSRIKGGRLAVAAAPARLLTLAISDVPHDDPSVIASGPTVPDPTSLADARAVLARRGIEPGPEVAALLADPASESPKPGDPAFDRSEYRIVSRPADMIAAVSEAVRAAGYEPISLGPDLEGEAREVAAAHAEMAKELKAAGRKAALISGGELTVTIRGEGGRGGPNQEYALALALALGGAEGIAAIAGDTDGTDGGAGSASDPAGALVDPTLLVRASARSLDAADCLAANDSTTFFDRTGDLVVPGPTRTNVNDCRIILVG
ncbi:glycerate kinase type-2 family protein [Enterovirga rhinocerotis]|uniref:Glycerate 2-kinase n=1 Tax=Enterovirga rhinocerotis TaxID=1339210 RepID=A0A4R7BP25_9HYPH|nr:glycerate kinase [Enterovirga rhinocerotis]TDR87284.1 glycerate 2-kinase [Enterovirga rhinocerotis]